VVGARKNTMLIEIVSRTPLWVWALLAALLSLGLWQRRSRLVKPARLLILPLVMLALGLWTLSASFVAVPEVGLAWLAALAAGLGAGLRQRAPAGTHWDAEAGRLFLAGSWAPLLLILVIFMLRYTSAVALALHPAWRTDLAVQGPLALAFGALSGFFLGRTLGLWRLTRSTTFAHHAAAT
jgi:hypothetical protein